MSDRQWPATKLGSAWMTHDPDDGWYEYDNPSDAENAFGQIVDHLRDEASEAWHESADTAAWGIWIPIERLRLVATAWPDDDTEDGERCRDARWDALLDGVVERVEADSAALDFCVRRESAAFAVLRLEIERLTAEADALRAEVARLRPLRALFDHAIATDQFLTVEWHGPSSPNGATVYVDYAEIAEGGFDEAIAAACDRLGVDHG